MMSTIKKVKDEVKALSYYKLFLCVEIILTVAFLTLDLIWHGGPMFKLMMSWMNNYGDYYVHLGFASAPFGTNIYEFSDMACFPPLAYLMYAFFARIVGFRSPDPADRTIHDYSGLNMTIFILYNLICIVLLVYAVSLFVRKKGILHQVVFPMLLIFSYPVLFTSIQRGNSVLLVAILLSIALAWRDDPSKVKQEFAMILIAICAGLKIYPAVIGLLYLKEKRWAQTLRLLIYGVVLFFGPFVFFGGIEAIKTFFGIVFSLYGQLNEGSISGVTYALVRGVFGQKAKLFATLVQQSYLVFSLIAFFCVKNKRSEVLILSGLMALYVASGWMYTCVYLLPAMLVFFAELGEKPICFKLKNIPDMLAFILFLCVFSRPFLLGGQWFVYGSMAVILSLFNLVSIGEVLYRKWFKPIWDLG